MCQLTNLLSDIFGGPDGSKLLVTAFSGGVAGALLTQGVTIFLGWWRKPVLKIIFAANEPGCVVDTPAVQLGSDRTIAAHGNQRYVRVKLQNIGRSTANGVIVSIQHITFYPTNTGQPSVFAEEVFDLSVSLSQLSTPFDLGCGAYRFLDLFCSEQFGSGPVTTRFSVRNPTGRHPQLFVGGGDAGSYAVRLFASSNQSDSVSATLQWHWDGALHGLTIPAS